MLTHTLFQFLLTMQLRTWKRFTRVYDHDRIKACCSAVIFFSVTQINEYRQSGTVWTFTARHITDVRHNRALTREEERGVKGALSAAVSVRQTVVDDKGPVLVAQRQNDDEDSVAEKARPMLYASIPHSLTHSSNSDNGKLVASDKTDTAVMGNWILADTTSHRCRLVS